MACGVPENSPLALMGRFPSLMGRFPTLIRKRAEYCFESTVSEKRTHWASLSFEANSVSSAKNSVSSFWHTNNMLKGTHWVRSPELSEPQKTHWIRSPELSEPQKTHWVRCLKPYSPKPYSARFRLMGRFPECLNGPFSLLKIPWKTAHYGRLIFYHYWCWRARGAAPNYYQCW